MAQTTIQIEYKLRNLSSNPDIERFIIQAYNETSNQLSYYSLNKREQWFFDGKEDDCVIITIYGTTDNGEVLINERVIMNHENTSHAYNREEIENLLFQDSRLDTFQCEVEESVPSPNVSHPKFILDAEDMEEESNTSPNYYVQILEDMVDNITFIKLTKSKNNEIIDDTIELQSRSNYRYKLYKVTNDKNNQQFIVTGVAWVTWQEFNLETGSPHYDIELNNEKKKITIGHTAFNYWYNLPKKITKFIIKIYNETSKKLSYHSVTTEMKEWFLDANDDGCVTITIYGTTENGEVVCEDFYRKPNKGKVGKLSSKPCHSFQESSLNKILCELSLKFHRKLGFELKARQESNTKPNFYVLILKDGNTKFIQWLESDNNYIKGDTIELQSRRSYEYKLYKVTNDKQFIVTGVTGTTFINFKTCNSQSDVRDLTIKAERLVQGENVFDVKYLNREKPIDHPTIQESQKTGIMKKCLKDANGDEYSSINKNICGLHFSVNPVNSRGDLPDYSYFGDYRIKIVPEYLVEGCNLYFADFYCMGTPHWVILVLTKRGSEADKFCQHRLVKLDIKNNPFFYKSGDGYKVTFVFCEILYTEDINLAEMRLKEGFGEEYPVPLLGYGSSTGGIPKNPWCKTCNL